ncbi:MAG: 5'/3'-nucleotidase SurE [bacterium]|nr:5'/3'-nucleotidase SurE [bacterium]
MRILLTNDDGISAPGLRALVEEFRTGHEVLVVAPDTQRSAVSHACTFLSPIRLAPYAGGFPGIEEYSINGTPVDCVFLALFHLWKDNPPDIILSGVNSGANMGYDVMYSGTVAAAMEGSIHGHKAVAVSLNNRHPVHFAAAARLAHRLADKIVANPEALPAPPQTLYNLNVPDLPLQDIKGVKFTHQGLTIYNQYVVKRRDPWERDYYWLSGDQPGGHLDEGSDFAALDSGYASLTPIQVDCTNYQTLQRWRSTLSADLLDDF